MADDLYTRRQIISGLGAVGAASLAGCVTAGRVPKMTQSDGPTSSASPVSTEGDGPSQTPIPDTPKEPTEETQKTTEQRDKYSPLTDHYHSDTVVYNHDQLRLQARDSAVRIGETIEFTITNTGDSSVTLGCHNPTTIQKQVDGEWRDVVWTAANAYLTCATVLQAGHSTSEEITVARDALKSSNEEVRVELTPGQYRFVLLATDPYLAADFHVRAKPTERNPRAPARGCTTEDR